MRSFRYALLVAVGYAVLASLYIVISTSMAAGVSANVDELRRLETLKGVGFVAVTALIVLAGAWSACHRLELAHAEIHRRDEAMLVGERRVLAGLLAATTAHDANNVLIGAIADLGDLKQSRPGDPRVERLSLAIDHLVSLNRRLMETVRQGRSGATRDLWLRQEILNSIEAVRGHQQVRGCVVKVEGPETLTIHAHPLLVHQIVVNLVVNAAEAMGGKGRIEVRLLRQEENAVIEVHDNGPGVPAERRAGLFDAMITTKPGGTGLGLFSVRACAQAMNGTVEVAESPLGGACFRVVLPVTV